MKRLLRKLHLLLIRHGGEFENSSHVDFVLPFERHLSIVINHRYYTFDFSLGFSRGVYQQELSIPHAEIAAERAQHD